jgi:hypothetical protein
VSKIAELMVNSDIFLVKNQFFGRKIRVWWGKAQK